MNLNSFCFIREGRAKVCGKFLKADEIETEIITREIIDNNVDPTTERSYQGGELDFESLRGEKNKV